MTKQRRASAATTAILIVLGFLLLIVETGSAAVVTGRVVDFDNGRPVPRATLRILGSNEAMVSNDSGYFRLHLSAGRHSVKVSQVAYYSETIEMVAVDDSVTSYTVRLHPSLIEVRGIRVYDRKVDPAGAIILEAIRRKKDLLTQLDAYSFDAYTKLVIWRTEKETVEDSTGGKREVDSTKIILLTETQATAWWQQPDKFKQTITARRQSANIDAEQNLATIGRILNFNSNRIDIADYSVPSPTATDALDHYNYYLLDTIFVDSQAIFRLEVEPKNPVDPLFVGTIDIADSSFAVVGVDVGLSEGIDIQYLSEARYRQRMAEFENKYWMPVEIAFSGHVEIDIPLFGFFKLDLNQEALISNYRFDPEIPDGLFDEYVLEVSETADDVDSAAWYSMPRIEMTQAEEQGMVYIDSVENAPKSVLYYLRMIPIGVLAFTNSPMFYDFFHFNRVEGPYVGVGLQPSIDRTLFADLAFGYAFDGEYWQHEYGLRYRLEQRHRLEVFGKYRDRVVKAPTAITPSTMNPTFGTFFFGLDAFDYYLAKGFTAGISAAPTNKSELTVSYSDELHYSTPLKNDYYLFRGFSDSNFVRPNPAVDDGRLRSVTAELTFDSRDRVKSKKRDLYITRWPFTQFAIGGEYASDKFGDGNPEFARYWGWVRHERRLFGFGLTSLYAFASGASDPLPRQRFMTVDPAFDFFDLRHSFMTLTDFGFVGDHAYVVHVEHDFERLLFRKSGIPLIKDSPFSLFVFGGVFWTEFRRTGTAISTDGRLSAPKPYREIGAGISRLPMFLSLRFAWQLSKYNTSTFAWDMSMRL